MNKIEVKCVLDSFVDRNRVTTFSVKVPLLTWTQILTHRVFSRNSSSNRAIPTKKLVELADFTPDIFPKNDKGMSPTEFLSTEENLKAVEYWQELMKQSHETALKLSELGVHKEIANRVLAPFIYIQGLITSSEWENFIQLRTHESTQKETRLVADAIRDYFYENKTPEARYTHAPYIDSFDNQKSLVDALMISAARCARVSYLNHEGSNDLKKDLELAERLLREKHLSPFEHQVLSSKQLEQLRHFRIISVIPQNMKSNFKEGMIQFRKLIEIPVNATSVIDNYRKGNGL